MNPLKRAVVSVCVWLGGDDPRQERLPSDHAWLLPGPSLLNSLITWASPVPQPVLAVRPAPQQ
jgi:hypothetical protein